MEASLNLTNPVGYAEQVSLGAEYGSQSTSIYRLGLTKPKAFGRPLLADVRLHQLAHNFSRWSSYAELLRGGALTLSRCERFRQRAGSRLRAGQPASLHSCGHRCWWSPPLARQATRNLAAPLPGPAPSPCLQ